MSASTLTITDSSPEVRRAVIAWSIAFGLGSLLIGAGFMSSTPLPIYGWAAAFLFLAMLSDLRFHRIPNALTLPAVFIALVAAPWVGATNGYFEAFAGVAVGFALLIGPYALGGMGAGDVKSLMALGAWLGPAETCGATAWAVIAGGVFSVIIIALHGELAPFVRRWGRNISKTLILRRITYERPAAGSIASGGIPFAAAIAVGVSAQWYGGSPW